MWGCSVGGGHATRFDWEDESTVKLFQRTVEKSEYEGLDPQGAQMVEDRDDEKDTGGYSEAKNPATNGPKEMEQNLEDTSNVNNGHSDDYQACAADDTNTSKSVSEQNQVDMDSSEKAKVLKKPDKILPCPRCNSLDTKFCYYNNYNVNQPRYFCRSCQRYWTAGGTMRNVPVGAGKRKSKHSASHCQQLLMSSNEMPTSELDARDSIYGQDHPSEHLPIHMRPSMVDGAVLKHVEEENASHLGNQMQNGDPLARGEYAEEISVSYEEASQFIENKIPEKLNQVGKDVNPGPSNGFIPMPPLQCFPAPLWPYMWNPLCSNDAPAASGRCMYPQANHLPNSFPWNPPPMVGICVPPIPFPFIQASAGSCISSWPTGPWAMPWLGPNVLPPPPCTNDYVIPKNKSPISRKHSRVVDIQGKEKAEKSLWIPKTLRIDDPDEAARSSIWATLGIRPDLSETGAKDRIFKGFHTNTGDKDLNPDAKNVLHANPAALSRSQAFQEST